MIHRDRSTVGRPACLAKTSRGVTETDRAIERFKALFEAAVEEWKSRGESAKRARQMARRELAKYPTKSLFKRYRHDEVKAALAELFEGKCAYCEKRFAATQPMDVEHFRPKGEIREWSPGTRGKTELVAKPGYYWLAATWENLLPSCIDCNRGREQENARYGRVETLGKQNYFPIEEGSERQLFDSAPPHEKPLLLDPCNDRPEEHLRFDHDGMALPKTEKGRVSIEVYGLNRLGLHEDRRALLLRLRMRLNQLRRLGKLSAELEASGESSVILRKTLRLIRETMQELRNELVAATRGDSEFALMARQLVAVFQANLPD